MKPKTLQAFTEMAGVLGNPSARSWKDQGRGVMGYFCSAIPEEICHRAPIRPLLHRRKGASDARLARLRPPRV